MLDPDGHRWTLRSQMEWRQPDDVDDFEHDVSASSTSAFVLFGLIIVLAVVLVVAIPEDVVAPWSGRMLWLGLLIVLTILFFPTRWALRRPWRVVAETGDNGEGEPVERWVGSVRGVFTVRQQLRQVARDIHVDGHPSIEGPLQPVVEPVA
ncbi:DUF983 domain-containing protein [Actinophytocola sp.]|uniref:DUF983 domain-containing protein n=1 Tax=Actinophytocola sp. TaxID=1872138 RepID=UPI002ED2A857